MQALDIQFGNGLRWHRLETVEDGMLAQKLNGTAVGHYFERELEQRKAGQPANEYYALVGEDGSIPVTMQVWHDPEQARSPENMVERNIVVGMQNRDPFPEFGAEIRALAEHIGRELDEYDYPYARRTSDNDGGGHPSP